PLRSGRVWTSSPAAPAARSAPAGPYTPARTGDGGRSGKQTGWRPRIRLPRPGGPRRSWLLRGWGKIELGGGGGPFDQPRVGAADAPCRGLDPAGRRLDGEEDFLVLSEGQRLIRLEDAVFVSRFDGKRHGSSSLGNARTGSL